MQYKIWECIVCGFLYNEEQGRPEDGIAPGTLWEDVPEDWECPDCGVSKMDFEMYEVSPLLAGVKTGLDQTASPAIDSAPSNSKPVADSKPAAPTLNQENPEFKRWECLICGFIYDEAEGWPEDGIAPGTRWQDVPDDWECPDCGVGKMDFEMYEVSPFLTGAAGGAAVPVSTATQPQATLANNPAPQAVQAAETSVNAAVNDDGKGRFELWECLVCGLIYDEALGWPEDGIAPGTRWQDVPEDWECPDCGVGKKDFEMIGFSQAVANSSASSGQATPAISSPIAESVADWSLKPVVIVGTGLAGYNLAREFRKLNRQTPLIMLSADDGRYYSKPMVSTAFAKGKQPDQLATASAADMARELDADIRIFTEVSAIDAANHRITANDDGIEYHKLVLATGAQCVAPPLQGDGLSRVFHINNLLDYCRFRTATVHRKRVLIIGAGLIGSEYANDMIQCGYEIDVVEFMPSVLATLLPPQLGQAVQQSLEQAGVRYHLNNRVERIDKSGTGVTATLTDGTSINADLVLSAIGVRPNLRLAETAGLGINRGIKTDRSLQTSADDVYALGDCAEVDGHLLYYVAPLMESAKTLARVLNGEQADVHYGAMPVVIKTTLCPITVSPPAPGAEGQWHIDGTETELLARFLNTKNELLGFALSGNATKERDSLAALVPDIIS